MNSTIASNVNDEGRATLTYRILRYVPNLIRDEWVNIGVLLEERGGERRAIRLIEEDSEFRRLRRIVPAMDEEVLRNLGGTFDAELRKPREDAATYLEKLDSTLSNAVQWGPMKAFSRRISTPSSNASITIRWRRPRERGPAFSRIRVHGSRAG